MRRFVALLVLAASGVVLYPAPADTLRLSNGGELSGTLTELEFQAGGAKVKYARAAVSQLGVVQTGQDAVRLADGTRVEGELVGLKFRSVGGELPFERKDVTSVTVAEDPLASARKELEAKRAAVPKDDAKALFDLASWCSDKGLKAEAAQAARQSLAVSGTGDFAAKVHELAGDVLYKGQWMTTAEMIRQKEQDEAATRQPGDKPPVKVDPAPKPEEPKGPPDGTYSTSAKGYKGFLTVAVKMADGKIAGVRVTKNVEDRPRTALAEIPNRIVAKQSADVDVVTGATFTSKGIMKAVKEVIAGLTRKPADGIPDGTYTGSAKGYVDQVKVSVKIKDGRFDKVGIASNRESRPQTALTDVPQRMTEQQQVDVDTVTHATITSRAIIKAVTAALDDGKSKAKPAAGN